MKLPINTLRRLGGGIAAIICAVSACGAENPPPTVYQGTAPAPATVSEPTPVGVAAAEAAPPPAAAPKYSASQLEKLVAPIALYPDPLIASILPASVYPLEIVQAARFVKNTNNLAKLDAQPWDENVKAVARIPEVIQKMDADLDWTTDLGQAFLDQQQEVMDTIQKLRGNAQKMGALQTTPQQVVIVTNTVVERTVEERVVVVTNTIVQIQPANPQIVYVPQYTPTYLYAPPPAYVYNPLAPLITFGMGMAVGAIIANNNCNWYHGGIYHGGGGYYHGGNVNVNINNTVINNNRQNNINAGGGGQKWQPDQNRLRSSGSPATMQSARTQEARGWGSGGSPGATARPGTGAVAPSTRPSVGSGTGAARPSPGVTPGATRPGTSPATRPSPSPSLSKPAASPSISRPSPSPSPSVNRASPTPSRSSAFGSGGSGASTRSSSNRGAISRGGGGGGRMGGGGRGR